MERRVRERADPYKKNTMPICIFMMGAHLKTADWSNGPLLTISNVCLSLGNKHISPFLWSVLFMYITALKTITGIEFPWTCTSEFLQKRLDDTASGGSTQGHIFRQWWTLLYRLRRIWATPYWLMVYWQSLPIGVWIRECDIGFLQTE
jgi:hypothetical protein